MKHPAAEAFEFLLKNAAKNGDPHVQSEAGRHMAALNAEFSKFDAPLEMTGAEEDARLHEAFTKLEAKNAEAEAAAEAEAKAMSEAKNADKPADPADKPAA